MYLCTLLSQLKPLTVDGQISLLSHQGCQIDRKSIGVIKTPSNITYMYMGLLVSIK